MGNVLWEKKGKGGGREKGGKKGLLELTCCFRSSLAGVRDGVCRLVHALEEVVLLGRERGLTREKETGGKRKERERGYTRPLQGLSS